MKLLTQTILLSVLVFALSTFAQDQDIDLKRRTFEESVTSPYKVRSIDSKSGDVQETKESKQPINVEEEANKEELPSFPHIPSLEELTSTEEDVNTLPTTEASEEEITTWDDISDDTLLSDDTEDSSFE